MTTAQESPLLASFINHQQDLLSFLSFKMRCAETAEDLVQETYLRIANYPDPNAIDNPRAFFFRIADNLALDHLRKRAVRDRFTVRDINSEKEVSRAAASHALEPVVAVNAIQQLERLEQLIADLPPIRQQVFLLSRVEGLNYKAIALKLGISERTVENHVYKALKTLKERFTGHE
jgi:RNA polymerase sigma-70 factor, ECF subfamily